MIDRLAPYFAYHIRSLGDGQAQAGYEEFARQLAEHLMVLFLWEKLPEELLQLFWSQAPAPNRRHAMWFMGREMATGREFQKRASEYWQRRLQAAVE